MSNNPYIIKIENLTEYEITPNQYVLLNIINNHDEVEYINYIEIDRKDIVKHDLYMLYRKEYILNYGSENYNFKFSELEITQKGIDLLNILDTSDNKKITDLKKTPVGFDNFIKEYYDLWPEKVYSGNYPVKSGLKQCSDKMLKFMKEYKHDREIILKATKKYIEICRGNNYSYMKTAYYFIKKDSESILQTYCEQVLSNPIETKDAFSRDF
jgi:hypothetical protein